MFHVQSSTKLLYTINHSFIHHFGVFFSKMLPSVKFTEDKVLVFIILCEKC